jgi:hypothetical protein
MCSVNFILKINIISNAIGGKPRAINTFHSLAICVVWLLAGDDVPLLLLWRHGCSRSRALTQGGDDGAVRRKLQSAAPPFPQISRFGVFIRLVYHKSLSTPTPSGRERARAQNTHAYISGLCIFFPLAARARTRLAALKNTTRTHADAIYWCGVQQSTRGVSRPRVAPKHARPHVITNT